MGTRKEKFEDYDGFVDKFKPKLTTDDCYTPEPVYEAVRQWVSENIMPLEGVEILRPFWPGASYRDAEYPEGAVVLDNPPFSCLAEIRRFYQDRGIRYFLFAPALTCLSANLDDCIIVVSETVTFANGANVPVAFVTNLDTGGLGLWVSGQLSEAIRKTKKEVKPKKSRNKYKYSPHVLTTATARMLARPGVELKIGRASMYKIPALDSQREQGKTIFGRGWLLSDGARQEAERARQEAERARQVSWPLSDREREIISSLE